MIIKTKKLAVYLLFLTLLTSCANSIIENAPWNNTPVPVVFSIISPNETVQVYLNRTYNKDIPSVNNPYPDAKVFLCGPDSAWVELTRLTPDTCIFTDIHKQLIIEKGKTYSLKVVLSDRTVHAQTTVNSMPALITNANCTFTGEFNNQLIFDSFPHFYYDTLSINNLFVKYTLPGDGECEYEFSAFTQPLYGSFLNNDGNFQTDNLEAPKDSTSFVLKLITYDPIFSKYRKAQNINSLSDNYSYNTPILAVIQSFGGVLPQFSNIVNGVGLFGNTVSDNKYVTIKPLAN
jgi:hypothetical protein